MVRDSYEYHIILWSPADKRITVANAVGPWVASYNTYTSGQVTSKADTPIWILIIAGLLLGLGFWSMYHRLETRSYQAPYLFPLSLWLQCNAFTRQQDYSSLAYTWICDGTRSCDNSPACQPSRPSCQHDSMSHWSDCRRCALQFGCSCCQLEANRFHLFILDHHITMCRFDLRIVNGYGIEHTSFLNFYLEEVAQDLSLTNETVFLSSNIYKADLLGHFICKIQKTSLHIISVRNILYLTVVIHFVKHNDHDM